MRSPRAPLLPVATRSSFSFSPPAAERLSLGLRSKWPTSSRSSAGPCYVASDFESDSSVQTQTKQACCWISRHNFFFLSEKKLNKQKSFRSRACAATAALTSPINLAASRRHVNKYAGAIQIPTDACLPGMVWPALPCHQFPSLHSYNNNERILVHPVDLVEYLLAATFFHPRRVWGTPRIRISTWPPSNRRRVRYTASPLQRTPLVLCNEHH